VAASGQRWRALTRCWPGGGVGVGFGLGWGWGVVRRSGAPAGPPLTPPQGFGSKIINTKQSFPSKEESKLVGGGFDLGEAKAAAQEALQHLQLGRRAV